MRKIYTVFVWLALQVCVMAASGQWMTDYDKAVAKAQESNKPILINFTGSDWCGWCIRLKEEVFSKPQFKSFAAEQIILLEVDFPRRKSLPTSEKKKNQELSQKYNIQGFPTLIILSPEGQQIGKMGYMEGGPAPFIAELKKITGR